MPESEFEDLLKEARNSALSPAYKKINRRLWVIIFILWVISIVLSTATSYYSGESFDESLNDSVLFYGMLLPFIIVMPALLFSLLPYRNWKFEDKLLRLFLIFMLLSYSFTIINKTLLAFDLFSN